MKHVFRIAFLGFLILGFGAWSKESRLVAAGPPWKSPPQNIAQASCHPACQPNQADKVPINIVAPDGLDPKTAKLECSGNGCQFDHGDVVLHNGTFIGTYYSRSEAVTIYAVADWKN